mmetsp:Transcript_2694/g.6732  ORF Transcript_2694/g.6732 Transcript_2694/m.6732 type:complete len:100 (-) Transcript_2694:2451-2750(-)
MVAELVDLIERHTTTSKLALVGDARENTSRAHAFHGQYAVPIWVDSSYLSAQRIRLRHLICHASTARKEMQSVYHCILILSCVCWPKKLQCVLNDIGGN